MFVTLFAFIFGDKPSAEERYFQ